jgi:MFS family permease
MDGKKSLLHLMRYLLFGVSSVDSQRISNSPLSTSLIRYLFFVARGMQGLASAGAVPAALGILGANYGPGKRRNKVFASFSAGNPIGFAFGLILGGLLTSYVSWRWVMWIIGIFLGVISILSFFLIPNDPPRSGPRDKIDWIGAVLITSGLVLFCFGLTYIFCRLTNIRDAEVAPKGWATWYIIFCLIIGVVLSALFIFVESRVASPLMPLSIWRVPQFGTMMLAFGLGFGAFAGPIIFGYSLYYQQIYQASAITV